MTVQNTKENPDFASNRAEELQQIRVEAANYALLRRLAPSIRHNMAGSIQPVAMSAALLKKRLQKPETERLTLEKTAADIAALGREAATIAVESMAWFAPPLTATVALVQGIEDCLHLLQTPLSFQGFEIDRQALEGFGPVLVARGSLRSVFTATLLAMTDSAAAAGMAGVVRLAAWYNGGQTVQLELVLENTHVAPADPAPQPYRNMHTADAAALALAESVQLHWGGTAAAADPNLGLALQTLTALGHATLVFAVAMPQPEESL